MSFMKIGNAAVILTIGLLVFGAVALALTVSSTSGFFFSRVLPIKPPPVNDPGTNNNTPRTGIGPATGSSGSGTIQK
jgi:hypothetical protein